MGRHSRGTTKNEPLLMAVLKPLNGKMALVMQAVDELVMEGRIAHDRFARIRSTFGDYTAIDLVWTVGQYC